MKKEELRIVANKISEDLEIQEETEKISEEDLLDAIAIRVGHLMDTDTGLLFSYLYRLDVKESALRALLYDNGEQSIAKKIAHLILQRQKERICTKNKYDQGPPIEGWEW